MKCDYKELTLEQISSEGSKPFAMGPFGSNIRAENYRPSGVPVIRGLNLNDVGGTPFNDEAYVYLSSEKAEELSGSSAFPGDIVFVAQGSVGRVGLVPLKGRHDRYILSQNLMKVTVNSIIADPQYVYYYYRSPLGQHEILSRVNPTGVPCISRPLSSLRKFKVLLPEEIYEQEVIAHILGTLDDKIELNRQMNETLEEIASAIFKSWFVDFDPVYAKAEGRHPALPSDIADLFPESFEDSQLGPIPSGWKLKPIPELIDINPMRILAKGKVAKYVEMKRLPTHSARVKGWELREFTSGTKFKDGDVLLARITPCLENGKTALVDFLDNGEVGWGSTEYIVLRSKTPLPVEYTYFLARSDDFRAHAISNMTGTSGRQRVQNDCFNHYPIILPDDKITNRFGELAHSVMERIKANDEESSTLASVRDSLLPKLISGELGVQNPENFTNDID